MRRWMGIMVGIALISGHAIAGAAEVKVGEPAPGFTVLNFEELEISLEMFRGSFVVLEWFNPECPFVKKHYDSGHMQRLQATYSEQGVMWFLIDSSAPGKQGHLSPEEVHPLIEERGATLSEVILDPTGEIGRLYGAKTTPHMFIIDPEGILIYQGAIDSIRSTDRADLKTAENYVQRALDEVLAGGSVSTSTTEPYGCSVKY